MNSYIQEETQYLSVINLPKTDIHGIAEHGSAITASSAENAEGFEMLTYTAGDGAWGNQMITDCLMELYEKTIAYCTSVSEDTIELNQYVTFNFIHPLTFEIATLSIIENKMVKVFGKYILKKWYLKKGMLDAYQVEEAEWSKLVSDVMGLLHRRVTPIRRMMNHFN